MSVTNPDLYFGRTQIFLRAGSPLDFLSEGIYTGSNTSGVMGAGLPAEIRRAAGADVERELRAQQPLLIGEAYLTTAGELEADQVKAIAHGMVAAEPGAGSRLDTSIRAMLSGLRLLEDAGCRTVTIPQIGWRVANLDNAVAAAELARVIVTHLRRRSKLHSVTIVSRHPDYLDALRAALEQQVRSVDKGTSSAAR